MKDKFYWIHPRTKVKISKIHGHGRFVVDKIEKNSVVMVAGGRIIDKRLQKWTTGIPVTSNLIIQASDKFLENGVINHSCSPNLILSGDICFYTLREVKSGEELTVDYGSFLSSNTNKIFIESCKCFSKKCRNRVTGEDWKVIDSKILSNHLLKKRKKDVF